MIKTTFKTLCALWITILMCISCGCSHRHFGTLVSFEAFPAAQLDTIKKYSQFNDSIIRIMNHPPKITCVLGHANPTDSLRTDTTKVLPKELYPILEFLFWDPTNFESNDIVFGNFSPSVNYIIENRRDTQLTLQFDFGLKKWRILDKNSNIVIGADLKDERLPILRFTRLIFPYDRTLKMMNDNINSLQK